MLETDRRLHENPFFKRTEAPKEMPTQKERQEEEARHTEYKALNLVRLELLVTVPGLERQKPTPLHNFEEEKEHPFITAIKLLFELMDAVANAISQVIKKAPE